MSRAGRRGRTRSRLAWGRGIPDAVADTIIPARYNNIEFLRRLFEREGDEIAAIIVEPVLGNAQGIMPKPGFHQAMRALTEEFGILLIFDEVKTGFRFAKGGAAEFFGIKPDLGDLRQGDGQRLSGRGLRWPRGGHERPARQGQPRRHVRRQPGRRRGRRQDARDPARHGRPRDDPRDRPAHPGRPARDPQPDRPAVPLHRPPVDVRDHVLARPSRPSTATGRPRTTSSTTRSPSAMHARGAMPEPDSREPWFICEAHAQGDIVDRVAHGLRRLARRRARGSRPRRLGTHDADAARWRTRRGG